MPISAVGSKKTFCNFNRHYSFFRLHHLLDYDLGWLAALFSVTSNSPSLVGRNAFQAPETRGSARRLTLVQCADVGEKWNLQVLVNLSVTDAKEYVIHNAKTHAFRTWLGAAHLRVKQNDAWWARRLACSLECPAIFPTSSTWVYHSLFSDLQTSKRTQTLYKSTDGNVALAFDEDLICFNQRVVPNLSSKREISKSCLHPQKPPCTRGT